jgi:hypothetical protein
MSATTTDWEFWLAMPEVKLWQAVALSLGIDPDRIDQSRDYWRDGPDERDVANANLRAEFRKRLSLLVDSRTNPLYFTKGLSSTDTPANHRLELNEVANWLTSTRQQPIADRLISASLATAERPGTPRQPQPNECARAAAPLTAQQKTHAWQEEQIRRTTRSLGFDPLALPPDDPKNNYYVKTLIRMRCEKNHPEKMRAAVFNKAWDRMRDSVPTRLNYLT